jgi:hypothetical protein
MQFFKFQYFFVFVQCHLMVDLCHSSPLNRSVQKIALVQNNQQLNKDCGNALTYPEFRKLFSKYRCVSNTDIYPLFNVNHRPARSIDGGTIDMKAFQNTINDNRIMIEYLFNNTLNHTFLAEALINHANRAPSLNNWRDIVDIICLLIIVLLIMYYLFCRIGLSPCDHAIMWLFTPVINRMPNKKASNTQQQTPPNYPSTITSLSDHLKTLDKMNANAQNTHKIMFNNTAR